MCSRQSAVEELVQIMMTSVKTYACSLSDFVHGTKPFIWTSPQTRLTLYLGVLYKCSFQKLSHPSQKRSKQSAIAPYRPNTTTKDLIPVSKTGLEIYKTAKRTVKTNQEQTQSANPPVPVTAIQRTLCFTWSQQQRRYMLCKAIYISTVTITQIIISTHQLINEDEPF